MMGQGRLYGLTSGRREANIGFQGRQTSRIFLRRALGGDGARLLRLTLDADRGPYGRRRHLRLVGIMQIDQKRLRASCKRGLRDRQCPRPAPFAPGSFQFGGECASACASWDPVGPAPWWQGPMAGPYWGHQTAVIRGGPFNAALRDSRRWPGRGAWMQGGHCWATTQDRGAALWRPRRAYGRPRVLPEEGSWAGGEPATLIESSGATGRWVPRGDAGKCNTVLTAGPGLGRLS